MPVNNPRRALSIGLCTAIVAVAFEAIAVATAMPRAAAELDGMRVYAWAFSAFQIAQLFATVAAGRLADRLGPVRPMMGGLILFAGGLIVAGTAGTMAQLITGRFVQGLASGLLGVTIYVCIARAYDPQHRPKMFSYISTAWVMPALVGPPISAWLTQHLGWPWVFFGVLPVLAFAAVMVLPTLTRMARNGDLDQNERSETKPAPLWAAALAATGAALIQLAGQRLDLIAIPIAVGGIAMLLVALPRLMPVGFMRFSSGISSVIVVRGLLAGAFFGAEAFIPLMLVEQHDVPLVLAGGVLTIASIGWTTGAWIQSRPRLTMGRDRLIALGAACIALGLLIAAVTAFVPQLWVGLVAVGWVCGGFGMGLALSSTSLATMTLSPPAEQGRNASSLQFGESLGAGLFLGISGSIFAALHPTGQLPLTFGAVLAAMSCVAVLAVWVSFRIGHIRNEFSS